ncbi:hypothetical protein KKH39_01540 [Patescibacteria group bacterium]|nr:hypothetical protein [Patescibacteria group bacterium]
MEKDTGKIIEKIMGDSGHDFHLTISKLLEEKEWTVTNSPHYNDPVENKPREIDIIAEKNIQVGGGMFSNSTETLTIRLIIECKYIKPHIVFWFLDKDPIKSKQLAKNNPILQNQEDFYLNYENKMHHYLKDNEAVKEFSTENDNKILDKAKNEVMHASLFYSNKRGGNYNTVNYPLILVPDFTKFKRAASDGNKYEDIKNNFEIEVEYTYKDKPEYFLIDVVSKKTIDDFLNYLDNNDIKILKTALYNSIEEREFKKRNARQNNQNGYW